MKKYQKNVFGIIIFVRYYQEVFLRSFCSCHFKQSQQHVHHINNNIMMNENDKRESPSQNRAAIQTTTNTTSNIIYPLLNV